MAAFRAAVDHGFGVECDVRASRDGVAFLFHDAGLQRMTDAGGMLADCPAEHLEQLALPDGGSVPQLAALLELCADATPLLIEIKAEGRKVDAVCAAVARDLARYPAASAAVMSFNPLAVRWFARHMPRTVRGLVVSEQRKRGWRAAIGRRLALWATRPDFIACDIRDLPSALSQRMRAQDIPVLSWTVRSAEERRIAARHADQIIFEDVDG